MSFPRMGCLPENRAASSAGAGHAGPGGGRVSGTEGSQEQGPEEVGAQSGEGTEMQCSKTLGGGGEAKKPRGWRAVQSSTGYSQAYRGAHLPVGSAPLLKVTYFPEPQWFVLGIILKRHESIWYFTCNHGSRTTVHLSMMDTSNRP